MFGAYWNYCQISDGVLYYTDLRPTENEVYSMNKTFKIVFNKARGALMVANEITGSVQKKGVRTITTPLAIAGGVALLLVSTPIYAKQMTLGDGDVNGKVITSLSDQVTISSPINKDDDS